MPLISQGATAHVACQLDSLTVIDTRLAGCTDAGVERQMQVAGDLGGQGYEEEGAAG